MSIDLKANDTLIAVVGLTASGKSDWALEIATQLEGEIVSIDSRQIYRRLDIGTAKPSAAMQAVAPHWCLDLIDPTERYSLGEYLQSARAAIADIQSRGKRAIAVGGSGQHMRALLEGWQVPPVEADEALRARLSAQPTSDTYAQLQAIDPEAAAQIGPSNQRRLIRAIEVYELSGVPISEWQRRRELIEATVVAPDLSLELLDQRITERTTAMFEAGFVAEVRSLLEDGVPVDAPGFDAIGYREVLSHLRGESDLSEAQQSVEQATRRFARRQRAWFRRDDPKIHWSRELPLGILE